MRDRTALLVLIAMFLVAVVVVDPRGDFPLDDDWGVGYTTFHLAQTGRVELTPFASATAYLQFAWGSLWALLFGSTFTVLRMATLTLSLASILLLFKTLREAGVKTGLALFGAAVLLAHPIFFWASFTSMTHVPFLFMSMLSMWCFARAWERGGWWLAMAFVVTAASFLTRQFAILNALAPLIVALMARRWRLAAVYAAAAATFAALVLSGALVASRQELARHLSSPGADLAGIAVRSVHYVFFNFQNAALFFAPAVLLLLFARNRTRLSWIAAAIAAAIFSYPALHMISRGVPIPYGGSNVFTDFGLGPPLLRDFATWRMPHPFALPIAVKLVLMILSTVGAVIVASFAVRALRHQHVLARASAVYLLCGTIICAGMKIYFDRYSLDTAWPLIVLLIILANGATLTGMGRITAAVMVTIVLLFSISGTAEYLAWNRARWVAFRYLQAHGVTLVEMDGGYEINAMLALRMGRKDLGKPGVGVVDDRYIIAFNRVPGYEVLRSFEYPRWLGLSRGYLHAERRK